MTKLPVVRPLIAWKLARAERTKIKFASVHVIDSILHPCALRPTNKIAMAMKFARNLTIAVFVIVVTRKSWWVTSGHDYRAVTLPASPRTFSLLIAAGLNGLSCVTHSCWKIGLWRKDFRYGLTEMTLMKLRTNSKPKRRQGTYFISISRKFRKIKSKWLVFKN